MHQRPANRHYIPIHMFLHILTIYIYILYIYIYDGYSQSEKPCVLPKQNAGESPQPSSFRPGSKEVIPDERDQIPETSITTPKTSLAARAWQGTHQTHVKQQGSWKIRVSRKTKRKETTFATISGRMKGPVTKNTSGEVLPSVAQ